MKSKPASLDHLPLCTLGEGPHWDVESQHLYWVDIPGFAIHRWSPATNRCERHDTGTHVGFVVLDEAGRLIAGLRDAICAMNFGSREQRLVARPDMHPENRFNDAACDPRGRLWAGTMHISGDRGRNSGSLYRLVDGGLEEIEPGIGISNGLGWSPDGATMYYSETHRGIVWAYAYDLETGMVGDRRVFADVPIDVGVPDGLTVDGAGRVFVAVWRGFRINVYAPDGRLDTVIEMPVPHATSCCFGGADLTTLYITTSKEGLSADDLARYPQSGQIFALNADEAGLPAARMKV